MNDAVRGAALPTLRLLTCGSVDDGKSTLIGRLLYEKKLIFDDQLSALERDSKKFGTTEDDIDFALLVDGLEAEREQGMSPTEAIYQACLLRFRPIMMTTMAALLGGLPLALGTGTGSELRRPLGITIVGGLIVSQVLTLFTTPVVYLFFDRLARKSRHVDVESRPHVFSAD